MKKFHENLRKARIQRGYDSAKAFWEFLKEDFDGTLNYSYYVKIEKGSATPSSDSVREIVKSFPPDVRKALIRNYCADLFPDDAELFQLESSSSFDPIDSDNRAANQLSKKSRELSMRQIEAISKSKSTYFLFTLSTLARSSFKKEDLSAFFEECEINEAIELLLQNKLLRINDEAEISSTTKEARLPEPYSQRLKELYGKMDSWDEELAIDFNFDELLNRRTIRRVSKRYFDIIQNQIGVLFDILLCSDEADPTYNEEILQMRVSLHSGRLPG